MQKSLGDRGFLGDLSVPIIQGRLDSFMIFAGSQVKNPPAPGCKSAILNPTLKPGAVRLEQTVPDIPTRLRTGFIAGLQTSWKLVRFVVPIYVLIELLKGTPLLDALGKLFAPAMALFGLPGQAAFAFLAAWLLNLYAALAILVPLQLDPWQVTQCGLMMGIAHNLLLEGGVLKSTGTRAGLLTLCRLLLALLAGLVFRGLHALGVF